jgi:hypothetical protein
MSAVTRTLVQRVAVLSLALAALSLDRVDAQPVQLAAGSSLVAPVVVRAPVPFRVGEQLTYRATFGVLPAGTARMRVEGVETIRGRAAYHVVFTLDGGVPFFRVHDRYDSWIDVQTLSSLRHVQNVSEGRYKRSTTYEIYPERETYEQGDSTHASVSQPLDDASFIYAVRTAGIRVGETRTDDRYFRPDRNPIVLTGLRQESVQVGAGNYWATVVRPTIKTNGIFSERGEAQVWFSDDSHRYPVLLKSKFSKFSLTLELKSIVVGESSVDAKSASATTDTATGP